MIISNRWVKQTWRWVCPLVTYDKAFKTDIIIDLTHERFKNGLISKLVFITKI